ncbi:MAG: hypothetical protein ACJ74O_08490 [Frankiaceae bacterium]
MTTETFPFTTQEPPAPAGTPDGDGEPGRRPSRRALLAGGGVLALAVVGGAFLLLSGGGGGTAQQGLVPHGKPVASSSSGPSGAGASAPATRKKLPVYRGAPAGRDPFKPLVTPPPPAAPPSASAPAPSPTSVPIVGPGTGPGTGGGVPTSTPTPSASRPAATTILVFRSISFTSGNVPVVDITFNGKSYRLRSGGKVDNVLRVISIQPDDSMAVFQVGDQTFDLHVGQAWVG